MRSWQPNSPLLTLLISSAVALSACGSEDPSFDEGSETGAEASASATTGTTEAGATTDMTSEVTTGDGDGDGDTTTGGDGCAEIPTRYVVLGDSVPAGVGTNGPQGDMNGFKIGHAYVESTYAGGSLTFENYSVGGAKTEDVPNNQLQNVPTGMPGHVLVNIHIGGNDLSPFIFDTDENAVAQFDGLVADALLDWDIIWAFFENPANFPDGATVIVNTQYNPFDDCDSPHTGVSLSDTKSMLLREYNTIIKAEVAMHTDAIVADQHPGFLGHGHNYDNPECATFNSGDYWMVGGFDFIHANQGGHSYMGTVFSDTADTLYSGCE